MQSLSNDFATSSSDLVLFLSGQALGLAHGNITFSKPLARLDNLYDIDKLFEEHDREADARDDPRPEAVHLVGACELERGRAVRVGEELTQQRLVDLSPRLDVICDGSLQQRRR